MLTGHLVMCLFDLQDHQRKVGVLNPAYSVSRLGRYPFKTGRAESVSGISTVFITFLSKALALVQG